MYETRAAEPLERTARGERGEIAETYPFAVWSNSSTRSHTACATT